MNHTAVSAGHAEQLAHLPDLSFVQICTEMYKINRGVYNTIEAWFYENGIRHIVHRRKLILMFFEHLYSSSPTHGIKFGHGGLAERLQQFWIRTVCQKEADIFEPVFSNC